MSSSSVKPGLLVATGYSLDEKKKKKSPSRRHGNAPGHSGWIQEHYWEPGHSQTLHGMNAPKA